MNLKTYLLTEIGCIENEYLDQYLELLQTAAITGSSTQYCELHHAVPVAYYYHKYACNNKSTAKRKYADKDVNNKIVKLLYKDHCKAHWLLFHCTTGKLKAASANAFCRMLNISYRQKFETTITEAEYAELQAQRDYIKQQADTKYWTAEQVEWLIDNFEHYSYEECGKVLNKTVLSVQYKVSALGLCKMRRWTESELTYLIAHGATATDKELAEVLNRAPATIASKREALGIKKILPEKKNIKNIKKEPRVKLTKEESLARRRAEYEARKNTAEFKAKRKEEYQRSKEKQKQYARAYHEQHKSDLAYRQKRVKAAQAYRKKKKEINTGG